MSTSKLQRETSAALSTHFGQYTIRENTRPAWLTDDTGARLELDFIIEELNVAIEVQGAQHYVYTPHFHGTYTSLQMTIERDTFKQETCKARGMVFFEVATESDLIYALEGIYQLTPDYTPQKILFEVFYSTCKQRNKEKRRTFAELKLALRTEPPDYARISAMINALFVHFNYTQLPKTMLARIDRVRHAFEVHGRPLTKHS